MSKKSEPSRSELKRELRARDTAAIVLLQAAGTQLRQANGIARQLAQLQTRRARA